MVKRLATLVVTAALVVSGLTVTEAAPAPSPARTPAHAVRAAAISCSPVGNGAFDYPGPGASAVYDNRFTLGHRVPDTFLDHFVPQGLGTWADWGGAGKDLVLLAGYSDRRSHSMLIGLVPGGGQTALVKLPKPRRADGTYTKLHVGGVAVVKGHLFIQGPRKSGHATIQRYSLSTLRQRLKTGGTLKPRATYTLAAGSSAYLGVYRDTLYSGSYSESHRAKMRRYRVADSGRITSYGKPLVAPPRTQGLVVTKTSYIFSTSLGRNKRSRLYVMRRSETDLDRAYARGHLACFPAPSMSEGITRTNGRLYIAFESGSFAYDKVACQGATPAPGCTLNILDNLHVAPQAKVTALV